MFVVERCPRRLQVNEPSRTPAMHNKLSPPMTKATRVSSQVHAQAPAREERQEKPERTPEIAQRICELVAAGHSMDEAARAVGFASWTPVYEWRLDDRAFDLQFRKVRTKGKLKRGVAAFVASARDPAPTFAPSNVRGRARDDAEAGRHEGNFANNNVRAPAREELGARSHPRSKTVSSR
jgi:hypothetical protein